MVNIPINDYVNIYKKTVLGIDESYTSVITYQLDQIDSISSETKYLITDKEHGTTRLKEKINSELKKLYAAEKGISSAINQLQKMQKNLKQLELVSSTTQSFLENLSNQIYMPWKISDSLKNDPLVAREWDEVIQKIKSNVDENDIILPMLINDEPPYLFFDHETSSLADRLFVQSKVEHPNELFIMLKKVTLFLNSVYDKQAVHNSLSTVRVYQKRYLPELIKELKELQIINKNISRGYSFILSEIM